MASTIRVGSARVGGGGTSWVGNDVQLPVARGQRLYSRPAPSTPLSCRPRAGVRCEMWKRSGGIMQMAVEPPSWHYKSFAPFLVPHP